VVVSAHDPFADRLMASQGTSSGHLLIAMSACAQRLLRQITVVPRTRDAERGMRSALVKQVGKIGRACVGNMFGRTRYDHANQDDEMTSKPRFQLSSRGGHRLGAGGNPGGRDKATIERELRAAAGIAVARTGLLPIDVMPARMRGEALPNGQKPLDEQFQATVATRPLSARPARRDDPSR
jgi:hypothetical protein